MKVVLLDPKLTIGNDPLAEKFCEILESELLEYVGVEHISTTMSLHSLTIQRDDLIIVFNTKKDQEYSQNIEDFLLESVTLNCDVIPVALYSDSRTPESLISHKQSFEVLDQLRQRHLTYENIDTIAFSLTRLVLSMFQPTMAVNSMDIFISHRRADGEELASAFYNEFNRRANEIGAFRDLISIRVGENAQQVIEENLIKSDAVVFIDTPLSIESEWVIKELKIALGLNLPIVWIRVGPEQNRAKLPIPLSPADKPHFWYENLEISDLQTNPNIVDDIIHKAFKISRINAMNVLDNFSRLKRLANSTGFKLVALNKRKMLYQITLPRKEQGLRYPQRPIVHVLQLFGRNPNESDRMGFEPEVSSVGFSPHPQLGYYFDSGLLLGPNITSSTGSLYQPICVESIDAYVNSINQYLNPKQSTPKRRGVIISGAFPDCEPDIQQFLTNAVHAIAKAIFDKGGIVIFGSHPTFQHLILDLAKRQRPSDYIDAVHMYISRYFVTQGNIDNLASEATIYATDNINNNRDESLTVMRKSMVNDPEAAGIILLGGKQHKDKKPGVDEEYELALQLGLPAYFIGSVGGRSSQLAKQILTEGKKINSLTLEQNEKLLTSINYNTLAEEILQSLGF